MRVLLLSIFIVLGGGYQVSAQTVDKKPFTEAVACTGVDCTEDRLSSIRVTADRDQGSPGLVLGVGRSSLDKLSPDHPAEAINALPAVNIQMNSGQEHLIAIRSPVLTGGAGQGSFLILENGLPTRSPAFGNVNALFEPNHEVAEYVEVVAGPGSSRYGSNAVHGLINFALVQPGQADSRIHLSGSTLGRYKGEGIFAAGDNTLAALSLQSDAGWRKNTGVDQHKLYLASSFELAGWDALAWLSASNLNQESAGFINGTDAYQDRDIAKTNPNPEAYRDAKSARVAVRFNRTLNDWNVILTPFARWQEMEFRQHFLPYKGIEENGHSAYGIQARADRHLSQNFIWRFGLDADIAKGFLVETQDDAFGFFPGDNRFPVGVHYDYSVDTQAFAIWMEADWQVSERLKLLAGMRAESQLYEYTTDAPIGINGRFNVAADRDDDFELFTPKFGVVYSASAAAELFANFARGQRAPQASDLYRLQASQRPGEVRVETLDSLELGMRGEFRDGMIAYQLAAYAGEKDNFFFRDGDGLNVTNGTTRHNGVDGQWSFTASDQVSIEGSFTWADHTYTFDRPANGIVSGNKVDTAPEWLADLAIVWAPPGDLSWRIETEYIGSYFTDPANSNTYPGHTIFHVGAQYRVTEDFEAYVRVRNVFNKAYADRADFAFGNERYFPGEPINATVGFRKTFGQ